VSRSRIATIALAIALLAAVWSLVLVATGGFDVTLLGVVITAHDVTRPAALGILAAVVYLVARGPGTIAAALTARARGIDRGLTRLRVPDRLASWMALLIAIVIAVIGVERNAGVIGGADSYGYVSQAELWRQGVPILPQPFAAQVPWPNGDWTFTPLGYQVADGGGAIVPTYSVGLPLVMAGVKTVFGHAAMFWIAPLAGAALVLVAYGAGRRLASPQAGLVAAWLTATSPALLGDLTVPTSDLLAAAALSAACLLLLRRSRLSVLLSGLAVSIALLVRPNLATAAAVLGIWLLLARGPDGRSPWRVRMNDVLAFALAAAPGVLIPAWSNWLLHGSPFVSGYGGLSEIYQWRHLPLNLQQYPARFVDAHAWLTPVGLAAVLIPVRALWPSVRERSTLALVAVFVASLIAPQMFYDPVHGALRFFLPALPFLASGTAVVALFFARPGWRGALVGLALAVYGANVVYQAGLDVRSERKYSAAGEAARARSERGSILFAMQHSGSARYYAGRMTLRYDLLDPAWLDRSVDWLSAQGVRSYALLDDWEVKDFKRRFAGQARVAQLDVPVFVYQGAVVTHFYDLTRPSSSRGPTETIVDRFDGPRFPRPAPPPRFDFRR
jgi:hypothetical protein